MGLTAGLLGQLLQYALVISGSVGMTGACFLVLPLIQAIASDPRADTVVRAVDPGNLPPPPPPPPEPEPEKEPEPEEKPPEMMEEAPPLDLAQLELALSAGVGDGWMGGDFGVKLQTIGGGAGGDEGLFSLSDLDQTPRAIYQPSPMRDAQLRKLGGGKVWIMFIVDQRGRVESPIVQSSSDAAFDKSALAAVKKWKFEPGKRNGKAVRFRMRVPITFPEK